MKFNTTMMILIKSSIHFLYADWGMVFSFFSEFSFMPSIYSKCLPWSGNFSSGIRKKLHGAISSKYGAWTMTFALLVKNLFTSCFVCWCKIHTKCQRFSKCSAREILFERQNLGQTLCYTNFSILKNYKALKSND